MRKEGRVDNIVNTIDRRIGAHIPTTRTELDCRLPVGGAVAVAGSPRIEASGRVRSDDARRPQRKELLLEGHLLLAASSAGGAEAHVNVHFKLLLF